jgi:pantetheine-phosphate adenylyltransferase
MSKTRDRAAIYPGTFDPTTNGHISIIERATQLCDRLIVAVAESGGKAPFFTFEERLGLLKEAVADKPCAAQIEVIGFNGLLADLAVSHEAFAIVRGLRAVSDFEYEFQMALMNRKLARSVETVFLMPSLSWVYLSSTIVKDVAVHGGEIDSLVPECVSRAIKKRLA